jgi:uncharacterized protein YndB with AHSA1/START domain
MSEIITQFDVEAPPATVWAALTTAEGIRGWWTTQAEIVSGEHTVVQVRFPDAPMSWDFRVDEALKAERLGWHCVGGPPPWIGTDILFRIGDAPEGGTRVVFDHAGWTDAEEMVRVVTFGWVEMFQRLKAYAASGQPQPYFDF